MIKKNRLLNAIKKHKISKVKLIFLAILTTIVIVNLSLSRYKSFVVGTTSANVALMAHDVDVDFSDEIKGYPGCDPKIFAINLTNKENNKICEVKQKFKMKIEREETANLPIEIALYKDAGCTQIIETDENGYYNQDDFIFDAGVEQTKTIYLKIIWPEARKNPAYAFEIDYFALHIVSSQVD